MARNPDDHPSEVIGWQKVAARRAVQWADGDRPAFGERVTDCDHRYQANARDCLVPNGSRRVWYCATCGQKVEG
jgi:hypothetical protein